MATTLKRPDAIQEILVQACARNELLILVTPFLRFESYFLALVGGELHVAATMGRDDALFGLRSAELKIRFPVGLGFMEAPVRLVGLGLHGGRRTLRLTVPRVLEENDDRTEYRVERVGRVEVTYGTPRGDLVQAALVDLSTRGARIHTHADLDPAVLGAGSVLFLSIPLTEDIRIEARGEVRHLGPRTIGLEFAPQLPDEVQEPLSRWVFRRREEDQERLGRRVELSLRGQARPPAADGAAPGVLLAGGTPDLQAALPELFRDFLPVARIGLSAQEMKDALQGNPLLAVFLVDGQDLDQRRRVKALVALAAAKAPVLLLGTRIGGDALFQLGRSWKAASTLVWNPDRGPFLLRLARGILRQRAAAGPPPARY